ARAGGGAHRRPRRARAAGGGIPLPRRHDPGRDRAGDGLVAPHPRQEAGPLRGAPGGGGEAMTACLSDLVLDEKLAGEAISAVELYVRTGERVEPYDAARRYRGGDTLQLVYTASAPRHLAVVDVEAGGKAELIYRSDGPLPPAKRRRLDRSWVLDDGAAAERL